MLTFKGNGFVNVELTSQFEIVIFAFYNFAFAEATVCVSVASFVFFHRQVQFQSGNFVVFCVPNATIFFQGTFNVRFEFVGDVQGFAVSNQTVFNFYGEASGFGDAVENFVEVVIESLAANCEAVFVIVVEHFVQSLDIKFFFANQKICTTGVVSAHFSTFVSKFYQAGRKFQNFCQVFALSKKFVVFALCFAVDYISKFTVDATTLFQSGFVHFSAPFFHSAFNLVYGKFLCFFSFY